MNDQNQNGYPDYNNQNYNGYNQDYQYYQQQMYQNNGYVNQNGYYYPNQNMYYQYPYYQYNQQYYQNYPQQQNLDYQNFYNQQYYNNQNTNNYSLDNTQNSVDENIIENNNTYQNQVEEEIIVNDSNEYYETSNSSLYQQEQTNEISKGTQEFKDVLNKVGIDPSEFIKEEVKEEPKVVEEPKKEEKTVEIEEKEQEKSTAFSVLDRYGEDLTKKEYVTNPAIAREDEIQKLILVLLTPDKSACLVGKPGIGKTAIVEGLAYRILNNNVPNVLKGYRIMDVATSSLLGESVSDGERDSRIQLLVQEIMKQDKIILFIDEIHTLMGAGAKEGSSLDFANILKPALARGNVKLIGATTADEYERYMIRDRAFIRRFEKIEVAEPDIPTTVKILMGSYPRIEKKTGVKLAYTDYIKEKLMKFIVEMTSEYKRFYELSSRYPDISLALLSKAFSYAIFENCDTVKIRHFWLAVNTCNSIYPDSRAKEVERFKEVFADLIKEENLDVNAPIDL